MAADPSGNASKDKRKEAGTHIRQRGRRLHQRFYSEPVNFRSRDGRWKDIDTTLVLQEKPGSRTMSVEGDGLSIGYAVEGASPPGKTYAWYAYAYQATRPRLDRARP
ncbi:hypothetical protein SAMN04487980_1004397 [Streptomyces sp. cf124]|uniref:hypothetical protein n=1 Tax=Streptomyces sp. cf124 TaxID=1761903 RepID=UPI0008F0B826|nr:hypothetical protein [Streptomyces sp. cf124]SFM73373.1 hypothetical protein SAMN04487980_1004397 [Streptomyces sp. cf124]